jgi:hypothetical protein
MEQQGQQDIETKDVSPPTNEKLLSDESIRPQQMDHTCSCGKVADPSKDAMRRTSPSYVYTIGRIDFRYPTQAIEKEMAQTIAKSDTTSLTDRQTIHTALKAPENRYLAQHLCWVLTVEGLDTYILVPRDPSNYESLIEAVRPSPRATDVDVVIGTRGPLSTPDMCNGLIVPIVFFDKIYSFDIDSLVKAISKPANIAQDKFDATTEEVFSRVIQMTDNTGSLDEHRALNYLAVRYPPIYAATAEAHQNKSSLTAIDVRPSPLSGVRRIVDVIFSYTNRTTDVVDKKFVRVDVTEKFPFLVTKLSPYYDR